MIVGDPFQIESIEFGNWFKLVLVLFSKQNFIFNLEENHRARTNELQKVWDAVRNLDGMEENKILELTSTFEFAKTITKDAFKIENHQVVLCLNYDGLYGINNLNRYFNQQISNKNLYTNETFIKLVT